MHASEVKDMGFDMIIKKYISDMLMGNFSISGMIMPEFGMGEMTVKSGVQMEVFKAYTEMKMLIEMHREQGMTEDDLPMIKKMREGKMKNEIMKMHKKFLNEFGKANSMAKMIQNTLKNSNPYANMAAGYATVLGKMLEDQEGWDQAHDTVMCMYDAIADGDDLAMAYMIKTYLPREEFEAYSMRLHSALHTVFKSPNLGEAARQVADILIKEMIKIDVDSMFMKVESILLKLRDIAIEMPFEKIIFEFEDMWRKTSGMMMIGQAPELEKMMDSLVMMLMDDSFWQQLDAEMMYAPEMIYNSAKMMAIESEMLSDGCDVNPNPFLCCAKTRVWSLLEMVEHLSADIDSGDLEDCTEVMGMMMEEVEMMVPKMMQMAEMVLEKHMIGCMIDMMVPKDTDEMKMQLQEAMAGVTAGAVPVNTLNYVMDNTMEIMQSSFGACPEGAMQEPWAEFEAWAESEPESEPEF